MKEEDASLLKMIYKLYHEKEDKENLHWRSLYHVVQDNPYLVDVGIMGIVDNVTIDGCDVPFAKILDWDAFELLVETLEM